MALFIIKIIIILFFFSQSRGEYCKGGEEAQPPNLYPNDILTCAGDNLTPVTALLVAAILIASVASGQFYWMCDQIMKKNFSFI